MKIELAEQNEILKYEGTAREFFMRVLGMRYEDCLVTDQSALSDFVGRGSLDLQGSESLEEIYDKWDALMRDIVFDEYGVNLEKTNILLVDLFHRIENKRNQMDGRTLNVAKGCLVYGPLLGLACWLAFYVLVK